MGVFFVECVASNESFVPPTSMHRFVGVVKVDVTILSQSVNQMERQTADSTKARNPVTPDHSVRHETILMCAPWTTAAECQNQRHGSRVIPCRAKASRRKEVTQQELM
jgi:hypothetical protein